MQELLFRRGGEMGQFVYLMLSFLSSKRAYVSKTKISKKERKKPNLSELTDIM